MHLRSNIDYRSTPLVQIKYDQEYDQDEELTETVAAYRGSGDYAKIVQSY